MVPEFHFVGTILSGMESQSRKGQIVHKLYEIDIQIILELTEILLNRHGPLKDVYQLLLINQAAPNYLNSTQINTCSLCVKLFKCLLPHRFLQVVLHELQTIMEDLLVKTTDKGKE